MDQSSILSEEIKSWKRFEYALKEEDRLVFSKMLSECRENEDYIKAACSKDEYFSAESLFMVLILQQQKMINELVGKIVRKTGSTLFFQTLVSWQQMLFLRWVCLVFAQ
jgi:hypothetical protein